jgi:hypothetical protein
MTVYACTHCSYTRVCVAVVRDSGDNGGRPDVCLSGGNSSRWEEINHQLGEAILLGLAEQERRSVE